MQVFPAFFPLQGRRVVIVGGGEAARRKTRLFARTPAAIEVYATQTDLAFYDEFAERARFVGHAPAQADFEGAALVVVASEEAEEAAEHVAAARRAGAPVNAVDRPELCDWTTPSIVDRGEVVVGVATGGAAPVIARDLRMKIETVVPRRIGALAALARGWRDRVKAGFPDEAARRAFWERVLRGPMAEAALAGDEPTARAAFDDALARPAARKGVVHIVGAGPGDPELLTIKALRVLQDADVVFYDSLVSPGVLDLVRRDADRINVGKRKANHSVPQDDIHARLIAAARAGQRVVRLKGGDPFVFGRGGEELDALRDAGVDAHVVPGVSSALAASAAAGAALTHRDHAQAVTFVTGHAKDGEPDLDWSALARPNQTVVVFMGVGTADRIAHRLIAAGRAATTPVAVIENASLDAEIVATGALGELAQIIAAHAITGPAVLLIGETAAAARAPEGASPARVEEAAA